MIVYYSVLVILILNCCVSYIKVGRKTLNKTMFILSTLLLIFVSGFRYKVGTDYDTYKRLYTIYKTGPIVLWETPALYIIARFSALIYDHYATWFFIMAALTIGLIMFGIYRNSVSIWFSVALFLFIGVWHESFNIVKQSAALAVLFLGYKSIKFGKFFKWCVYCFFATLFHISAVFMVPVYFLARSEYFSIKKIIFVVVITVLFAFLSDYLFNLMAWLKQGDGVTESDSFLGERAVSWQRIIVAGAPLLFCFIFRKSYDFHDDEFRLLFYLSLLNFALYLFVASNSVYLARITMYTNVFNILFIPHLIKPFKKADRIIGIVLILTLYCIFWSYDLMKVPETRNFYWIFGR